MPSSNSIGTPLIELLSVESTNNYAMGLVRAAMAQQGTAVFAHSQTRGKGQRSKEWNSEAGMNIALSIVIEPENIKGQPMFLLSMLAASATLNFFKNYVADDVSIKWPNDIYWRDRKAAGILIENVWQGTEWKFAVIGIGINVNQTDFGWLASKAVSLKQITGKEFVPLQLAKELCGEMQKAFDQLTTNPSIITTQYRSHLYKLNQTVRLKKENKVFEGTVKDVTSDGQLVIDAATEEKFDVGEVEWII